MNKHEFVKLMASKIEGMTQKEAAIVIDAFAECVKEGVKTDDKVALTGFATFSKKHIPAKSGVTKLGGVEKSWTTEEKDEIKVSLSKSYKTI